MFGVHWVESKHLGSYRKGVCAWWEVVVFWSKFSYIFGSVLGGTNDERRFRVFLAIAVVTFALTVVR
eukprot:gene24448-59110_t